MKLKEPQRNFFQNRFFEEKEVKIGTEMYHFEKRCEAESSYIFIDFIALF